MCFHLPDQGWLFSGDTLFSGGPGATGRSFSDFGTIIASIRDRLLVLDPDSRPHRPRRQHHHWCGCTPSGRVDRSRPLIKLALTVPAAPWRTLAQVAPQQAGDSFAGLPVSIRARDGRQPFAEALVSEQLAPKVADRRSGLDQVGEPGLDGFGAFG